MAQQTAIDWLVEQFNLQAYIPHIQQAKAMEKEQIEWAWVNGRISMMNKENKSSEEYYKENYGTEMPNL